jgi:hypothetical protein
MKKKSLETVLFGQGNFAGKKVLTKKRQALPPEWLSLCFASYLC